MNFGFAYHDAAAAVVPLRDAPAGPLAFLLPDGSVLAGQADGTATCRTAR